jgi:hypothetical protein
LRRRRKIREASQKTWADGISQPQRVFAKREFFGILESKNIFIKAIIRQIKSSTKEYNGQKARKLLGIGLGIGPD